MQKQSKVKAMHRSAWKDDSAKLPLAALAELPALHVHEPFPRHAPIIAYSPKCLEEVFSEIRTRLQKMAT
jgi:hypothetical protein